jgi:hypothetical protein
MFCARRLRRKVMSANDALAAAGAVPRPLGATCLIGSDADTCESTCCGQRAPAPPLDRRPPPDDPQCVMPGTTRRGAFCRADCQCESGYCNVAADGEPAQPPQAAECVRANVHGCEPAVCVRCCVRARERG